MCHMLCVMCHMSYFTCHVSSGTKTTKNIEKFVELVGGGGLLLRGPASLSLMTKSPRNKIEGTKFMIFFVGFLGW